MTSLPTDLHQLETVYKEIEALWRKNLEPKGIKLPSLYTGKSKKLPTHGALQLIYLYCNEKKVVNKNDVQAWIRKTFLPNVGDSQIRHLGAQAGFNFYKGGEFDPNGNVIEGGSRGGNGVLWDLVNVCPHWKKHRDNAVKLDNWEDKKRAYNYRCATCFSKEGELNFRNPSMKTVLQKGHMNCEKQSDMSSENIIPQCLECNQAYRDTVNFNSRGLVISLGSIEMVKKSSDDIQRKIYGFLKQKFETT